MTNSTNTAKVIASPTMDSRQLASGFASMLLGSLLIALIGFAPMPAVHNAAHDTRHSSAFPCH